MTSEARNGDNLDCLVGQRFAHRNTGRVVEVIEQEGPWSWQYLKLRHASGRVTRKQRHYFDYDYLPNKEIDSK